MPSPHELLQEDPADQHADRPVAPSDVGDVRDHRVEALAQLLGGIGIGHIGSPAGGSGVLQLASNLSSLPMIAGVRVPEGDHLARR